jgi:hypothetical protein
MPTLIKSVKIVKAGGEGELDRLAFETPSGAVREYPVGMRVYAYGTSGAENEIVGFNETEKGKIFVVLKDARTGTTRPLAAKSVFQNFRASNKPERSARAKPAKAARPAPVLAGAERVATAAPIAALSFEALANLVLEATPEQKKIIAKLAIAS